MPMFVRVRHTKAAIRVRLIALIECITWHSVRLLLHIETCRVGMMATETIFHKS